MYAVCDFPKRRRRCKERDIIYGKSGIVQQLHMFRIHVGQDSNCWSNGGRWVRIQGSVCRHAILDEDSECGPKIRAGRCTACKNALIMFTITFFIGGE